MKTILIVEDDLDIRNILTIYLEKAYKVVSFSTGEDALDQYREVKPDLVLLDIGLPYMNGFEVCEKIRETDEDTPIIFISANRDEQNKFLGLKSGGNDFFPKPFDIQKLMTSIKKLIQRNQPNLET